MGIVDSLKGWAAAALPSMPMPKAPKGPQGLPGYRRTIEPSTAAVRQSDRQAATTDRLVSARSLGNTKKTIRELTKTSPDLSSALSFKLRTGIPERFTLVARDMDGKISADATSLAHELLRRLTYLGNADGSFGAQQGLQSLSEQLAIELEIEGAACLEVALDKARVPASFNPIAVSTLKFYEEDAAVRMVQVIGGVEIDLDLPTIIYTSLDQDLTAAYPSSPLEASVQPILADIDFNNDMRKALKRAVLPRLTATIDSDKVKKMTPAHILADPIKFVEYKTNLINSVESVINGLNPEDALVSFDQIAYAYIDGGKDPSVIIAKIQEVLNGKLSAGAKTMPTILGHGSNSNASSTEALLYLKQANMLRVKLNEVYSRAFTIAVRLMGQDCYVEFVYDSIDLRPEAELEAFKVMKQSRLLDLLSLGMKTDEEVCLELTGNLPPAGYKPLMGTMFRPGAGSTVIDNPASNTSAINQTVTSDAPKQAKSQNNRAEIDLTVSANQDSDRALESVDKALNAMQDMAFVMSQQANKPVHVTVDSQPMTLNLQMEQEKKPANRIVKIVRDEEGKVASMEVTE